MSKKEECNIKSAFQVMKEAGEEIKQFRKNPVIGDVRYCKRDKCIVIDGPGRGYDIPISRIKNSGDAFDWLCHLHEKTWFTPKLHSDLLEMMIRITNINEYCW